jgi:peptide-methionine (S)-S-oxide reductase
MKAQAASLLILAAAIVLTSLCLLPVYGGESGERRGREKLTMEKAYFAAGCFWKVQYIFSKVPGVLRTRVGYTGGATKDPTYRDVCSDSTGHAETVQVEFDPAKVSYQKLLQVFFANHDPTTPNRQGPDVGSQYRSAIFYSSPEQQKEATAYREELNKTRRFAAPVVTEIQAAGAFFDAEDYHQDYFLKHGAACH